MVSNEAEKWWMSRVRSDLVYIVALDCLSHVCVVNVVPCPLHFPKT